jgi:serine/threonine protein kinase
MLDHAPPATPALGDELPPGTPICRGQYTVQRYLNSGGFGVTYLAHDSLGRKVVIKECFPGAMCCRTQGTVRLRSVSHETDFERVVALFEREARALAQLAHPNVVGVHQIFKENGTAYMAMDFVEGPDLFDVLENAPELLEPAEIRRILDHLLKALAYVHDNGILHRDISPDNILLAPGGVPVMIDFGAAREDAARATRMLSRIQTVKDGYSPQEFYLAGSSQERSSDLYALAATIHHLIRGCPPPNSNVRLAAVAQDAPDPYTPLSGRISGYDDAFLSAIDTCLSLFARDRLRSAEAWMTAISGTPARNGADAVILSQDVQRRISELVRETAVSIEAAEPETGAEPEAGALAAAEAERAAQREYWAILNEDPAELRAEVERAEALQRQQEAEHRRARAEAAAASRRGATARFGRWLAGLPILRRRPESKQAMHPQEE